MLALAGSGAYGPLDPARRADARGPGRLGGLAEHLRPT